MSINPLLKAVMEKYEHHPEFLGDKIVDINQPGAVDDTMLHIAARTGALEDVEVLLQAGARVNTIGDLGYTPLHQAAMSGQVETVKCLLKHGADPSITSEYGETALDVAEVMVSERPGCSRVVSLLRAQMRGRGRKA